jgi:hypothetical protein
VEAVDLSDEKCWTCSSRRDDQMVVWYHPSRLWLLVIQYTILTQSSFEARAVALVVDPIFSPSREGGDWLLRLINPQLMMLGQEPSDYVQHWSLAKAEYPGFDSWISIVTITLSLIARTSWKSRCSWICTSATTLDRNCKSFKIIKSRTSRGQNVEAYQGLQ